MTPLRELRRTAGLSQQEFATLIDVPLNTFRMFDSGLRPIPIAVMHRAADAVEKHARRQQLLSLDQLARELGVHIRTLQAAARTGRLEFQCSVGVRTTNPLRVVGKPANDFSHDTTAGSRAKRFVRFRCQSCRTTRINACDECVVVSA